MNKIQYLVGITCLHAFNAWATEDLLTEVDYFSEQPVVLSASKLAQPVSRAPAAVTVITREMIEASGFRHLVDVLRLVPGFVVGWQGGNMAAAGYLGPFDAFPHSMQIMVDGRSVYNQAYGNTVWRAIPLSLDDVDRIEIVRGPNAANDGINSLVGTVHIFTRHSATTLGGMAEVAAGDKQFREVNLRYGAQSRRGSWRLGLVGRQDERHGVPEDKASDLMLSFRGDYALSHRDDLSLQLGVSRGFWRGTNVGVILSPDQDIDYLSGFANLTWSRALEQGREWTLQVHHTFNQNREAYPRFLPFDQTDGDYRVSGSGIRLIHQDNSSAEFRTSLSAEYRQDAAQATHLVANGRTVRNHIFGLSGSAEWNITPNWVLHAAGMLEHYTDLYSTNLSPRIALNWLPAKNHAFRIGASHAVSALGLYANYADVKFTQNGVPVTRYYLSSASLDPEKINSFELGYLFNGPARNLDLDVRAFANRIYDIVGIEEVVAPDDIIDGVARDFVNENSVTQRGIEYQLKWHPKRRTWVALSQSWVDADSSTNPKLVRASPRHTLSFLASHPVAGWDVSLGYYRIGSMRWLGADYDSKYNRLDLRLSKKWKAATGNFEAALVLQSLLGSELESWDVQQYERQEFDRRGYLSLRYTFR